MRIAIIAYVCIMIFSSLVCLSFFLQFILSISRTEVVVILCVKMMKDPVSWKSRDPSSFWRGAFAPIFPTSYLIDFYWMAEGSERIRHKKNLSLERCARQLESNKKRWKYRQKSLVSAPSLSTPIQHGPQPMW